MTNVKIRYVDFSPDEWIAGTTMLTNAERGLYITACALIYSHGGPISREHLRNACTDHGNAFNQQLNRLLGLGKLTGNDGKIDQKRCENELRKARNRAEKARENGAKARKANGLANPWVDSHDGKREGKRGENAEKTRRNAFEKPLKSIRKDAEFETKPNKTNALENPGRVLSRARPIANYQPSTMKTYSSPQEAADGLLLSARDTSPPLPTLRAGDAAPPAEAEQMAPSALDTQIDRAEAVDKLDTCLKALRRKAGTLDPEAWTPPNQDPNIAAFRLRLVRLSAIAGECLAGATRTQAWECLATAEQIGKPDEIPPEIQAQLSAIECLRS